MWCGTESPGTADSQQTTWSTSLAGLKFEEEKLKAGSLDNVGITLHNLLDEIPKYNVTHAVWITEQVICNCFYFLHIPLQSLSFPNAEVIQLYLC